MERRFAAFRIYSNVLILVLCASFFVSCVDETTRPQSAEFFETGWRAMDGGTTVRLRDVWGVDNENVFAVGDEGTILHYDGVSWERMNSGTTADLWGVWGCGPQSVYAAGENGTLLIFNGTNWTSIDAGTTETLRAVGGTFYGDCETGRIGPFILVGGPPGKVLFYDPSSGWHSYLSNSTEELLNLHVFHLERRSFMVCAVGRSGAVYYSYGTYGLYMQYWYKSETGVADDLFAVFGEPDYVFALAGGGNIYQNTKQWMEDPPSGVWRRTAGFGGGRFLDIAARSYNDIFIVGDGGRIVHYDRRTFTDMESKSFSTIRGVWAGDKQVFAVGDRGLILTFDDPPSNSPCPVNVRISVTDEQWPVIRWDPECPVSKLFVEDWGGSGAGFPWFIAADGNLIESGVRYGTIPESALEFCPAGALVEGGLYRVSLIQRDWDNEIVIGSWNIVPGDSQTNGYMAVRKPEVRGPDDWLAQASADPDGEYEYKKFFFLRIRQTIPGQPIFGYADMRIINNDSWRWEIDPMEREDYWNVRPIIVEKLIFNPETGLLDVLTADYYRAVELPSPGAGTYIWDILRP